MKQWIKKVKKYLTQSLGKVSQELNELDWKEALSPENEKLSQHICAFANLPGGGYLVFGINSKNATPQGINKRRLTSSLGNYQPLAVTTSTPQISI